MLGLYFFATETMPIIDREIGTIIFMEVYFYEQ